MIFPLLVRCKPGSLFSDYWLYVPIRFPLYPLRRCWLYTYLLLLPDICQSENSRRWFSLGGIESPSIANYNGFTMKSTIQRAWGKPHFFTETPHRSRIYKQITIVHHPEIRLGRIPLEKTSWFQGIPGFTTVRSPKKKLVGGWWLVWTPLKNMTSSIGMISNPILMGK